MDMLFPYKFRVAAKSSLPFNDPREIDYYQNDKNGDRPVRSVGKDADKNHRKSKANNRRAIYLSHRFNYSPEYSFQYVFHHPLTESS